MAQTMTAASIGRVNRRFLFLALILAALSAVLVYPLLTRSSDSGGSAAVGISVVVARTNINAGQTITAELLEVQQIPETVVGALAFSEIDAVAGEVARYPIVVGEQVLVSKIVGGSISVSDTTISNFIESGKRAMAIRTDPIISAGGLVLPGDTSTSTGFQRTPQKMCRERKSLRKTLKSSQWTRQSLTFRRQRQAFLRKAKRRLSATMPASEDPKSNRSRRP